MDLGQAKKQQEDLQKEAEELLASLDLTDLFSNIGEVKIVGSMSYQLLVLRDIDLNIIVIDPLKEIDNVVKVAESLLKKDNVRKVTILKHGYNYPPDEGKPIGIYIGIQAIQNENLWKIDAWVLEEEKAKKMNLGFSVSELNQDQKDKILLLKAQLSEAGRYGPKHDYYSADVYRAVFFKDISTVEDLDLWSAKNEMLQAADRLASENPDLYDLLLAIKKHISKHARSVPERREAKTLLESRLTPAEETYARGMVSCGTIASISAAMLRHLGYKVKLVDGRIPKTRDHAWISIYNEKTKAWEQYDLTQDEPSDLTDHVVELECDNWEDIREHLEEAHKKYVSKQ